MVCGILRCVWPVLLLIIALHSSGQQCKCEVRHVNNKDSLAAQILADPTKKLVKLQSVIPGLVLDLRYATTNNFTHKVLYRHPVACMRAEPAEALKKVQAELNKKGLGLKIYDAFRPFAATCMIWRLSPDRHYTANPKKGSNHNRGMAVDLTIIDFHTGKELDMGTGFDCFNDSAHHDFQQLPPQVLANRQLLRNIMNKYGFGTVPEEWWHYQWRRRKGYEVIDMDFDELAGFLR